MLITLVNVSSDIVPINSTFIVDAGINFEIKDSLGNKMSPKYLISIAPFKDEDIFVLKPGNKVSLKFNLNDHYRIENKGEYAIIAHYAPMNFDSVDVWNGEVNSNKVTIRIK